MVMYTIIVKVNKPRVHAFYVPSAQHSTSHKEAVQSACWVMFCDLLNKWKVTSLSESMGIGMIDVNQTSAMGLRETSSPQQATGRIKWGWVCAKVPGGYFCNSEGRLTAETSKLYFQGFLQKKSTSYSCPSWLWLFRRQLSTWCSRNRLFHPVALHPLWVLQKITF